ncbi:MAG: polyisoprenoid-binding protein [Desulfobulbaceae bacterium]|uniref:Polyisoprenoid-binding protein n=1 Tax=Candidatus Desulfobia pelagia TaxID=2841692 RepID=A0A8J6NF97_9BACT|nr:polyisoprenoid-binding protein [Candidatus Desulfobia pelagia]
MKKITAFILVLFSFVLSGGVKALAVEWEFDKAHSGFRFGVKHIFSTVYGHFDDYSGKVIFDPDNLAGSMFRFEVNVDSIQTNINKRDNHLLSGDFFDAKKYPEIIFESTSIKHVGGKNYEVTGKLTIKDVTKEVILPVVFHGIKGHPMEKAKQVAGFDTHTTINRLEYHVGDGKFYEMGVVDQYVDIFVSLEMLSGK